MSPQIDESHDGTGEDELYRSFAKQQVTLYHGTRQSLASAILKDGFRPPSVAELLNAVADRYALPLDELQAHLRDRNAYTVTDDERAGTVSTTADRSRAARWAGRAPEATWDSLRSVYALAHPQGGQYVWQSLECEFWVMVQRLADPPVVVEIGSHMGALQSWGHSSGKTAVEMLRNLVALEIRLDGNQRRSPLDSFMGLYERLPEWRIQVDQVQVGAVHPVPTMVPADLLAFMSEQPVVAIFEQEREGRWGKSGNPGRSSSEPPWWPFDEVWPRLRPERRAQLEEFAESAMP